ncbi:MAG: hypothetical protein JXR95_00635 [Deltaproteobacteria bacterium]|nr:hypothetical protein [Deltaproteobacteria bacterium]
MDKNVLIYTTGSRDISFIVKEDGTEKIIETEKNTRKIHEIILEHFNIIDVKKDVSKSENHDSGKKVIFEDNDLYTINNDGNSDSKKKIDVPVVYPAIFLDTLNSFRKELHSKPQTVILLSTMRTETKPDNEPVAVNTILKKAIENIPYNNDETRYEIHETGDVDEAVKFLKSSSVRKVLFFNFLTGDETLENACWRQRINKLLNLVSSDHTRGMAYVKNGMPAVTFHMLHALRMFSENCSWKIIDRAFIAEFGNSMQNNKIPIENQEHEKLIARYHIIRQLKAGNIEGARALIEMAGNPDTTWRKMLDYLGEWLKGNMVINKVSWPDLSSLSENKYADIFRIALRLELTLAQKQYVRAVFELVSLQDSFPVLLLNNLGIIKYDYFNKGFKLLRTDLSKTIQDYKVPSRSDMRPVFVKDRGFYKNENARAADFIKCFENTIKENSDATESLNEFSRLGKLLDEKVKIKAKDISMYEIRNIYAHRIMPELDQDELKSLENKFRESKIFMEKAGIFSIFSGDFMKKWLEKLSGTKSSGIFETLISNIVNEIHEEICL